MDDTKYADEKTVELQRGIELLNAGDASARGELLNLACRRLMRMTAEIKGELEHLDEAKSLERPLEELFSGIATRFYEALHDAPIRDVRHFFLLASRHIRGELIELCQLQRSSESSELTQLSQFHQCVDNLPETQREVFELIYDHELSRPQVAKMLGSSEPEIQRLWRSARLELHQRMSGREGHWGESGGSPADIDTNSAGD